jgi:hypothetical protein
MRHEILSFLNKVQEMRLAQKNYFKLREKSVLIRSKQLELEVDQEAERLKISVESVDHLEITERARVIGELLLLSVRVDNPSRVFINALIEDLSAADILKPAKEVNHG